MNNEIQNFKVLSIRINTDYETAFKYLTDNSKLPEWTNQFVEVDGNKAKFDTFNGIIDVEFETISSVESGTIDWKLTLPDGSIGFAYSRLTRNIEGVIYAFNFIIPFMDAEELEKAVAKQIDNIHNELSKLKKALEN
ncbi:hypothetical protein NAL32_19620 [Chryseobacterium sp. Ch-15]|uniref:Polyketide cyclase / dehydrase and lipid transport n=1 Tax=Chryseobacterium muglaense TaxID=2893752 RepID=A0A9Q3URK1_9FLAO|nr:hypothetical protein [Chryseobacterium muglaense]MBD3906904.1 hypothetical protein [Chryseobacterium muglaense]MCC9033057.1 hypothetical protein [Chryseobacterium muglaense]MCM2556605.1 hypothetical protein [Chryseobacterium muglaense]